MPVSNPTFGAGRAPIVDDKGNPTRPFLRQLNTWTRQLANGLNEIGGLIGDIPQATKIVGRTEGIGTTVQKLTPTGEINTDNVIDGVGSPLTGGKRGFQALTPDIQLQSTFVNTPVNTSLTPTGATSLSNDGVSTAITIAAGQNQFAPTAVSYNSGTVDPGAFGTYFVFSDDPQFQGGPVTYQFSNSPPSQTAAEGRVPFGIITTVLATPKTGGGHTGGTTPGGGGGRGYNNF